MTRMSKKEIKEFLVPGTFTAKRASIKKRWSPHIVPIWFILDDWKGRMRNRVLRDIIFTTYKRSLKAKNIQHNNWVSICLDVQASLFSFVTIHGIRKIYYHSQNDLFKWATKIKVWYMEKSNIKVYGKRNSTKGTILRIKPTK